MKKEFIGFYDPTEKEINDAWSKGTFAFDTNTLLNLYRYTDLTRKDFLTALKTIKDKLFLPHQAALEFHSNRVGIIEGIGYSYSNLYKVFENNFEKNLESQINQFKKHPSIVIDNISKLHSEFLKKISTELEKQKKTHPDFKTKDEVLEQLTDLFENATGKEFSKDEMKKIFIEGKDRRVICVINDKVSLHCALMPNKDTWFIMLNQHIQKKHEPEQDRGRPHRTSQDFDHPDLLAFLQIDRKAFGLLGRRKLF